MKMFKFRNPIKRGNIDGKPDIEIVHDIYILLTDDKTEGVAFTVGTRLKHNMNLEDDSFILGEELAVKLGIPDKVNYRIRTTVPFLVSSLRLTEMTKEARGYVVGYDKRMSDFKLKFESYLEDDSNQLSEENFVIDLVPSLGISLKLQPGRGLGDVSKNLLALAFSRPGIVEVPFQMPGEITTREIDFDRGYKKLLELLNKDSVNVQLIKV